MQRAKRPIVEEVSVEALLAFAGLALLAVPFVVIWLVFDHAKLRKTVEELSTQLADLQKRGVAPKPTTASAAEKTTVNPWTPPPLPKATAVAAAQVPPTDPEKPPKNFVFDPEKMAALSAWMKENWFYAIAALSLAMAGIFFVQYGIEQGILSPRNRVLSALGFGTALIAAAEWVRRRGGDGANDLAGFVPSTFAGAGIVTLFAGILSARQLYDLIGQEAAFGGLVAIAALAMLLGWVYGSFLTAIGIFGAVAAPFAVSSGQSEHIAPLFYYFALICAVGLSVDAMKRLAWISTIALVVPYAGASLLWVGSVESTHFLAFASIVAIAACCIPTLSIRPAFGGAMGFNTLHGLGEPAWPEFPTRLAMGGLLALAVVAILVSGYDELTFWLAVGALAAALAALAFWFDRAPVLDDLAIPVALALLAVIGLQGMFSLSAAEAFTTATVDLNNPAPKTITVLTVFGLATSAMLGWKSLKDARFPLFWAAGAAMFAPAVVVLVGLYWQPMTHLSPTFWAVHVMAVAALMTMLAERAMRVGGGLRVAVFALSALNMIALSMSIVLTETALTLGFAGLVVSAAWLDRKFDIKPVTWFVQLGVAACGYRLIADPGLPWALETSVIELCIGFLGVIALLAAAWWLLRARERTGAIMVTESACWSLLAIFISILIFRVLEPDEPSHWVLSLWAIVWLISAATQLYRAQIDDALRWVRMGLGTVFGVIGLTLLAASATAFNPLRWGEVQGPPVIDSLLIAYLIPALICGAVAWRFTHLDTRVRIGLGTVSAMSTALYVGLEIRRIWRGTDLTVSGVLDGELYTYTIVMLLLGTATLILAFLRRSPLLRKLAVGIIALTIAKVFLIDMSGLEGLIRVLSFLALGLVLTGLALLNRWMTRALEAEA